MAAILNSAILDSAILHKKTVTQFWLNLRMAAIQTAILDSDTQSWIQTLVASSSDSATKTWTSLHLTLTQTKNISLKLIHSHSNWWWQPSWILLSLIQPFCTKKTSLVLSDSTWWWQPSWILPYWIQTLPSWIQTPCYLLSDSLKNTLTPFWLWLKLIQSDSNSFILT